MAEPVLTYLNQLRPANTTAASIYSLVSVAGVTQPVVVRQLWICNTGNSTIKASLYFDNDGTTYDDTTKMLHEIAIPKNATEKIDIEIPMRNSAGNLAVQTDTANDATFTLFGDK